MWAGTVSRPQMDPCETEGQVKVVDRPFLAEANATAFLPPMLAKIHKRNNAQCRCGEETNSNTAVGTHPHGSPGKG